MMRERKIVFPRMRSPNGCPIPNGYLWKHFYMSNIRETVQKGLMLLGIYTHQQLKKKEDIIWKKSRMGNKWECFVEGKRTGKWWNYIETSKINRKYIN